MRNDGTKDNGRDKKWQFVFIFNGREFRGGKKMESFLPCNWKIVVCVVNEV